MAFEYAIHSDFLIYWTGKDIDQKRDWGWEDKSVTTGNEVKKYLERLEYILNYGLWMTEEDEQKIFMPPCTIRIPKIPKCCFTELKLSEARRHAREYGRLGIGVKRPFMFNRYGRPLTYFGYALNDTKDKFLKACADDLEDSKLLNFFKPMNSSTENKNYDLYRESEWRIIYFDELLKEGKIVDPRNPENKKENDYFISLNPNDQDKLKYLIPLDGWFSMIIYPSLKVKNKAQQEHFDSIRSAIENIKDKRDARGNRVEGGNWPIEVDLDACRNF